jgi:hypothetical protein
MARKAGNTPETRVERAYKALGMWSNEHRCPHRQGERQHPPTAAAGALADQEYRLAGSQQ